MTTELLILTVFFVCTIVAVVSMVHKQNYRNIPTVILGLNFGFAFLICVVSGGSALNDAPNDFELYQVGQYYLVNHGTWTQVTNQKYIFVLIVEIVGIVSFVLDAIINFIRLIRNDSDNE